jgi:hypothetical protein
MMLMANSPLPLPFYITYTQGS